MRSSPDEGAGTRVDFARGAMLFDAGKMSSVLETQGDSIFEPGYWRVQNRAQAVTAGRGSAWFVRANGGNWVLRHYRRGGAVGKIIRDQYLWTGEARVRSFAEWRITSFLHARGLPVPVPLAARYTRRGLTYRCDLITSRIEDAVPISSILAQARLDADRWRAIGASVAAIHAAGCDHADLNAHNILLDARAHDAHDARGHDARTLATIIDFDRARIRSDGAWRQANLARLARSLQKISRAWPRDRYTDEDWQNFLAGYRA